MQTQLKIIIDSRNYLFALNIYWTHCCESLLLLSWQSARPFKHLLCDRSSIKVWTIFTTFLNANVPNNLGRGLPLPPHPQIDPIYTVCEKWTKKLGRAPPPIIWTKSKRTATFFRETFPKLDEDENSFCLRRVTCIFHFDLWDLLIDWWIRDLFYGGTG